MAFHAIKAGEGDQYIAAGVEAVSRAGLGAGMADEFTPEARRLRGLALRRLHPDGADRRERRRALQRQPRGAGRVGGRSRRTARSTRRSRATSTPRSSRDRAAHTERQGRQRGRRPERSSPRTTARGPGTTMEKLGELKPAFRPGRHRHRRQRLPAQRRRRRRARHVATRRPSELGLKPRARIIASTRRRDPPRDHGPRPDPGDPGAARADRA